MEAVVDGSFANHPIASHLSMNIGIGPMMSIELTERRGDHYVLDTRRFCCCLQEMLRALDSGDILRGTADNQGNEASQF